MKKLVLLSLLALFLLTVYSCKRRFDLGQNQDTPSDVLAIPIKELSPPRDFNYETHKDLYVRVGVKNPLTPSTRYLIKVYTNVPTTGELVKEGQTSVSTYEYATYVRVPASQEFLWIEKINPDGTSQFNKVQASTFASTMFDSGPNNVYTFHKSGSGMDCSSSCDQSYNNHTGNITINSNNDVYCITGTYSGSITINGKSSVKICGNATITSLTLNNDCNAYILEGAQVTITNLVTNNSKAEVKNWCDSLVVTGSMNVGGKITNNGRMYASGAVTINSDGEIKNYDKFAVSGSLTVNEKFKNYHLLTVGGSATVNSDGNFDNYCYLSVGGSLTNNGDLYTSGLIAVTGAFTHNSSAKFELNDGAMLTCDDITINNKIEGKGNSTSVIEVADRTVINSNGEIKGKLNLCDDNGVETNNGSLSSGGQIACTGSLPTSTCNPLGFNVVVVQDDDSDGVPNSQDAYPNDATRAFDSYYPSGSTFANIAFEDLWPNTADYDFNDMVIAFNIQKVLNADEKVVDMKIKVNVRSVGGSFDNGFGFRLDDLAPNTVSNVTGQVLTKSRVTLSGNNTEAGQDKAVIICFDSPEPTLQRAQGSFFNTIKANAKGTSDTILVTVSFGTPQNQSTLDIAKINPFIFTNGRRGYEIHLGNFAPTSLADNTLFGTGQDASNSSNGTYYKTANNLPWAILIDETFDYPQEKTPVNVAHRYFNQWAISGGTEKTNWYQNLAQYRVTEEIFE